MDDRSAARQHRLLPVSIAFLAVAVLASGTGAADAAARAVTSIGDKKTGVTARVFKGGTLAVGDGKGALTVDGTVKVAGSTRVTDGSGALTVDGQVTTPLPSSFVYAGNTPGSVAAGSACTIADIPLPTGAAVLVERVSVSFVGASPADAPKVHLQMFQKVGDSFTTANVPVPMNAATGNGEAGGQVDVGVTLRGNAFEAAAPGDLYQLRACFNRGSAAVGAVGRIAVIGRR